MFSSDPTMDYGLWQGRKCTFDCYFSRKSAFLLQRYHMVVTASVTVKVVNGRAVAARCCLKILCIALVPRPDTIPSIPLITSTVQHPSEMPFWFKIAFFAWQSTLLGESLWAELVNDRAVPRTKLIFLCFIFSDTLCCITHCNLTCPTFDILHITILTIICKQLFNGRCVSNS